MGRQSQFKQTGGFLKGVDGIITGYRFTDEFNGEPFVPGQVKDAKTGKVKDRFHSLYLVPSVRVDGAEEDITVHLFGGNYNMFTVSEDGQSLTPNEDGYQLGANTALAKFIESWEAAAQTGAQSDDEAIINFAPMVNCRCRFDQAVEMGRDGKPLKRIAKTGKYAGQEFDVTTTIVTQVYGHAPSSVGRTAVAARPTLLAPAPRTTTTFPSNGSEDIKTLSCAALLEILMASPTGSIVKPKLSQRTLLTPALKGHPQREDVRKWLFNDDNLATFVEEGMITYDKHQGTIALA